MIESVSSSEGCVLSPRARIGSPRVPPRGALLGAGLVHGPSLGLALFEQRPGPRPALVRHLPPKLER